MYLGISSVSFALLAATLSATTTTTDANASGLRQAEDTDAVVRDRNLMTAEKAMAAYIHSAADGTDMQEFEGYLTTAHFPTGDVQRLQFPNGLSRRIINLAPLDDMASSGGAKPMVMVTGKLIDSGSTIDAMGNMPKTIPDEDESKQTRAGAGQTKTVLVVRVMANDSTTTATAAELSDDIFGTGTADQLSVKEGYNSCSYGQFVLNPLTSWSGTGSGTIGTGSEVGTTTVTVSANANDMDIATFEDTITMAINTQFGVTSPSNIADFVLYCAPPGVKDGTSTDWGYAYSYVGTNVPIHWQSVYSDGNCPSHSTVMHEVSSGFRWCFVVYVNELQQNELPLCDISC